MMSRQEAYAFEHYANAAVAEADVGIRALALMPLPTDRKQAGQVDVPVLVQGVAVRPGDWLVADADGIVILDQAPV